MCIFAGKIESVSATNIFVTDLGNGYHGLVYEMKLETLNEVAMILPVPVVPGNEKNLSFTNLQHYPDFFKDMDKMFPAPQSRGRVTRGLLDSYSKSALVVHDVGEFVASFVPSINDFDRLDARFKLDREIWANLPDYSEFGFAVFQLKPGSTKIHPMAFSYLARNQDELFFPTTHVHDGHVPHAARYDHALYFQHTGDFGDAGWQKNAGVPEDVVYITKTAGFVHPTDPIEKLRINQSMRNHDHILKRNPDGGLLNVIYIEARG